MPRSRIEELLASADAGLADSAVTAVPMFKDPGLAVKVIAAWERHRRAEGFEARCLSTLRVLARQRLKAAEKKAYPVH